MLRYTVDVLQSQTTHIPHMTCLEVRQYMAAGNQSPQNFPTTQTTALEETNPFVDEEKLAAKLALCRNELVFLNVAS